MKRLLLLCFLIMLTVGSAAAQDALPAEIPAELEEQLIELEAWTSRTRGLEQLRPVARDFPTRAETIAYLEDLYSRELPPEEAERLSLFYGALGLLPDDISIVDVYLTLLNSQVAGFYDPDTQTMNVIPILGDDVGLDLSITEQIYYVHEFVHALQDQHFDLNALLDDEVNINQPDRALALTSLVEGDASAVMQGYTQALAEESPMAVFSILLEGFASGGLALPEGVPDVLVRELLFPYEGGMAFVITVYQEGGWEAVDALYANPPVTSEQVLHPEKYLAGEAGASVALGDLGLGESWTQAWDTTLGEYYLRELLLVRDIGFGTASNAAAGWGGDALEIYANDAGQAAWALRVTWDTPDDQTEFVDALSSWLDELPAVGEDCVQAPDEIFCVAAVDGDTLLFGAPDEATAATMRAALGI